MRAARNIAGLALVLVGALWLPNVAAADPAPSPRLSIGKPVTDRALARQRGGTETRSDAAVQGAVTGNQASNVTTGANLVTGGTLAGASGIAVVVQNSGNNVLIQSSVIVNLQLK